MKTIVQDFKSGEIQVEDLPTPCPPPGFVLVKNHYSLLSAGTERSTVQMAKASLLAKARKRPDLVKQVLDNLRKEGLSSTVNRIRTKLDSKKPLGYSSAGEVVESNAMQTFFKKGDRVACAGAGYAVHAEYVIIPENLCVPVPENITMQHACFATLGAIALQGVRRAAMQIGEKCLVIGLGLLGMLTSEILNAAGIEVYGIDLDEHRLKLFRKLGYQGFLRNDPTLLDKLISKTNGKLFDAVIVVASTPSNDPALLAGDLVRKKGRIIIVGDFKIDFDREPIYRKEVDIVMSTSYGPGRYDPDYEEKGLKYPYAYVRWTETENLDCFLKLVAGEKIRLAQLITHQFPIDEAKTAYQLLTADKPEASLAITFKYDLIEDPAKKIVLKSTPSEAKGIGFIGAGSFAQSFLLPFIKKKKLPLKGVCNLNPASSQSVAKKFGFEFATTDINEILNNDKIDTVFIATRHHLHFELLIKALQQKKNVFVEKPLCLLSSQLDQLIELINKSETLPIFTVGYNRRFAPSTQFIKEKIENNSFVTMHYSINAPVLPEDHWALDKAIGGGRLLGEFCHFIDYVIYFLGAIESSEIKKFSRKQNFIEDFSVLIKAKKGLATLTYTTLGNIKYPKERIEIFSDGNVFINNDFKEVSIFPENKLLKFVGKGHKEEIDAFFANIPIAKHPIPIEELIMNSDVCFKLDHAT